MRLLARNLDAAGFLQAGQSVAALRGDRHYGACRPAREQHLVQPAFRASSRRPGLRPPRYLKSESTADRKARQPRSDPPHHPSFGRCRRFPRLQKIQWLPPSIQSRRCGIPSIHVYNLGNQEDRRELCRLHCQKKLWQSGLPKTENIKAGSAQHCRL
mgnify:CR=1 FL=1